MATLEELKAQLAAMQAKPSQVLPTPQITAPDTTQDDTDDSQGQSSPSDLLAKFSSLKANPTQNPPAVKDIISKLVGQTDDDIAAAQEQRNRNQFITGLGQAGSTIGQAFQTLAPKQDYSGFWKGQETQDLQPVQDVKDKGTQDTLALQRKVLEGQAKTETSQADPNSAISKTMRELYKSETGKEADPSLAYSEIAKLEPSLARIFTAKQAALTRADALKTKGDDKAVSALKDTQILIETARGSKDIQSAKETSRLITNAKSLLSEYPDLNKMPASQVALFAQEMSKIAKGGVAGEAEVAQIMPPSIASNIMKGLGQLENTPTGAKLGAFLKEYNPYLDTIKKNSDNLVSDRIERVIKGQAPRLGEQNVALLRSIYPSTPVEQNINKLPKTETIQKTTDQSKPKTVTQNGHTYTLNETTGKYE